MFRMTSESALYTGVVILAATLFGVVFLLRPKTRRVLTGEIILLAVIALPIVEIMAYLTISMLVAGQPDMFSLSELKCSTFHGGRYDCSAGQWLLEGLLLIGLFNFITAGLISLPFLVGTLTLFAGFKRFLLRFGH